MRFAFGTLDDEHDHGQSVSQYILVSDPSLTILTGPQRDSDFNLSQIDPKMSGFSDRIYQFFGWRKVEPEAIVLFLGLDGSGKSTILSRCRALVTTSMGLDENLENRRNDNNQSVEVDSITSMLPTQGYDIKSFSLYDLKILAWDVGGQKSLRHGWRKYYTTSQGYVIDALVYVIDSADRRRIAETGTVIECITCVVMLYCNRLSLCGVVIVGIALLSLH